MEKQVEWRLPAQGEKVYGTLKGRTGWWEVRGDDWAPCDPPRRRS